MSRGFVKLWKVPKVERDVPAAIENFAGENVAGVGDPFTDAIKMIIGNKHESFVACKIGPIKAGLDLIVPGG